MIFKKMDYREVAGCGMSVTTFRDTYYNNGGVLCVLNGFYLKLTKEARYRVYHTFDPIKKLVILLLPEEAETSAIRHRPSPFLAGKMKILGDIVESPLSPEEWDLQLKQVDNNL